MSKCLVRMYNTSIIFNSLTFFPLSSLPDFFLITNGGSRKYEVLSLCLSTVFMHMGDGSLLNSHEVSLWLCMIF